MDHAHYETDDVAAQALALGGGEVLALEPVLVPLVVPETDLDTSKVSLSGRFTFIIEKYRQVGSWVMSRFLYYGNPINTT